MNDFLNSSQSLKKGVFTGIFISLGLVLIGVSFLLSENYFSILESKFVLYTDLAQSQGLSSGSQVALNGFTIGNVEKVEISLDNIRKVKVTIKIKKDFENKIPKDSVIELKTQGALGDRYLQITPGISQEFLGNHDYIMSKTSKDIIDIISEGGDDARNIFILIQETLKLVQSVNQNNDVLKILMKTQNMIQEITLLAQELKLMAHLINENERKILQETLKKIDSIIDKIDKGHGTLGALIHDPSIHQSLKKFLGRNQEKELVESLFQKNLNKNFNLLGN